MIASRALVASLAALALLAACADAEASRRPNVVTQLFSGHPDAALADQVVGRTTNVAVYVSDRAYDPQVVRVHVGQEIELVLHNIGYEEHHYEVAGMPAKDIFWLDQGSIDYGADTPGDATPDPAAAGEHDHQHGVGALVPMGVSVSRGGVARWGDEVHAWAYGGKMDVIVFTPTAAGTFKVVDPLHPQLIGQLIVDK